MTAPDSIASQVRAAVSGDRLMLQRALLRFYDRLEAHISRKLTTSRDVLITVEDILQETYVDVIRSIKQLGPCEPESFYHWLCTIADHQLLDAIKASRRLKRGRGARPVQGDANAGGSVIVLLEAVVARQKSPRSLAVDRETIGAVQVAMGMLTQEQRQAIQMRYLDGHSIAKVAATMNRTTGAVHMLLQRALTALRDFL